MELFIQVKDGQPYAHPIFGDNFREVFPHIDVENLPPEFARFIRVPAPIIGPYEVYEGLTYERSGDLFTDVHHVRQMTEAEKKAKQDAVKAMWAETGDPTGVWDEESCSFIVPLTFLTDIRRLAAEGRQ